AGFDLLDERGDVGLIRHAVDAAALAAVSGRVHGEGPVEVVVLVQAPALRRFGFVRGGFGDETTSEVVAFFNGDFVVVDDLGADFGFAAEAVVFGGDVGAGGGGFG